MDKLYSEISDYLRSTGPRLLELQGNIEDIGQTKENLTAEDLRIERALTDLVLGTYPDHVIYAEEEHDTHIKAEDLWVFDPISATRAFIEGRPHYASVVSYVHKGETRFAAVYDQSADELFTAQAGKGALLNGSPIHVSQTVQSLLLNTSKSLIDSSEAVAIRAATEEFTPVRNESSFAVNYCWVAGGRFDGVISVARDAFPEFAGALIMQEAGGKLTNINGGPVGPDDRLFVGGNPAMYDELFSRSRTALGLAA